MTGYAVLPGSPQSNMKFCAFREPSSPSWRKATAVAALVAIVATTPSHWDTNAGPGDKA